MAQATAHDLLAPPGERLVVAITARALFDLESTHAVFEGEGLEAYAKHQRARENDVLEPGIAFPLVRKLLALNEGAPADAPRVEVVLLSRNSSDTGLRIFNSIEHHGLGISRAVFTSGEPTTPYIQPFGAQLFLSANPESVRKALAAGVAAATILPAKAASPSASRRPTGSPPSTRTKRSAPTNRSAAGPSRASSPRCTACRPRSRRRIRRSAPPWSPRARRRRTSA